MGLAAPFNSENCYGETFAPEIFDDWLPEAKRHGVDMKLMHEGPTVGRWHELHKTPEGLWVLGRLTLEPAIRFVKKWNCSGLSVGYCHLPLAAHIVNCREARFRGYNSRQEPCFKPVLVKKARCNEISVVRGPGGAFKETNVHWTQKG